MLAPKIVLVTGANRGIGLEFVKQFLLLKSPPKYIFACCRQPDTAEVRLIEDRCNGVFINLWKPTK
ncbi:hypothetical protein DPMN_005169 [Dreissena polymorpha]|uniref:Uncharacterized protein n=1 Tax=Dreissena polymorpha TaxID=45954 RepID=A0A9D4MS65_DREPO|nr:hypothetical protein DPMN_005169 [Dreissena polymorpha]